MRSENNRGTLMIEAALIYPLFIFTIIAMLPKGRATALSLEGAPAEFTLKASGYAFSSHAPEFVRDIDLGADLIDFLLERFNLKERVDVYVNKLKTLRDKLGGTGR